MKMNGRRALIGFTLTMGLLLGLGLISLLDLPGWRAQAESGALGNQAASQSAATSVAAHKPHKALGASAATLGPLIRGSYCLRLGGGPGQQ